MAYLSEIGGVRVGHWSDPVGRTGCTVLLCPDGAAAGVDVRGGAPGTRETALLQPGRLVDRVHAILLTGGSAFGLAAADGVMRWLEERGFGFAAGPARVPIVPAAVLFDLAVGDPQARPDASAGYAACEAAGADPEWGQVGAGCGATVGKALGIGQASPGGIGTAIRRLPDGTLVAALVAVNAFGHVVDQRGAIIAGPRDSAGRMVDSVDLLLGAGPLDPSPMNTTIGVVLTDARLDGAGCTRMASSAHAGMARAIRPVHTLVDGDTLFALSLPRADSEAAPAHPLLLGIAAAEVVAAAIVDAVRPRAAA